jgi:hypothetical protein
MDADIAEVCFFYCGVLIVKHFKDNPSNRPTSLVNINNRRPTTNITSNGRSSRYSPLQCWRSNGQYTETTIASCF